MLESLFKGFKKYGNISFKPLKKILHRSIQTNQRYSVAIEGIKLGKTI